VKQRKSILLIYLLSILKFLRFFSNSGVWMASWCLLLWLMMPTNAWDEENCLNEIRTWCKPFVCTRLTRNVPCNAGPPQCSAIWLLSKSHIGPFFWSNAILGNECFYLTKTLKMPGKTKPSRKAIISTKRIVRAINTKEGQVLEIVLSTSLIISFDSIGFNVDLILFISDIHRTRSSSK
jgi:hypothetical protein